MDIKSCIRNFTACNTSVDRQLFCIKKSLDEICHLLPSCKKKSCKKNKKCHK